MTSSPEQTQATLSVHITPALREVTNPYAQKQPDFVVKSERNEKETEKKTGAEKDALPSIKATQKDMTKPSSVVSTEHKMALLLEILHLVVSFKTHCVNNTSVQWKYLQDQLEKQPIGSQYRRMDKPSSFQTKVYNALESWIAWANARGYPSPKHACKLKNKLPSFLEMVYKVFNEWRDRKSSAHSTVILDEESGEDAKASCGSVGAESLMSDQQGHNQPDHQDTQYHEQDETSTTKESWPLQGRKRNRNELDDLPELPTIPPGLPLNSPSGLKYLEACTSFLTSKVTSMKARQDDADMIRLEELETKVLSSVPGSILLMQYEKMRDRCLLRLESDGFFRL